MYAFQLEAHHVAFHVLDLVGKCAQRLLGDLLGTLYLSILNELFKQSCWQVRGDRSYYLRAQSWE